MNEAPIAVLGATGAAGFGLALRWAVAGLDVIIGSRSEERAATAAAEAGRLAGRPVGAAMNADAVRQTTMIVMSVPFAAQASTIKEIAESIQPGSILVDITVPLAVAVGGKATQTIGVWEGSAAQRTAALLKGKADVAAAFQNLAADALKDLDRNVDADVIVCGPKAVQQRILPLIDALPGARYVNGGPLENARHVEQITALLAGINGRYKVHGAGIRITGLPE